LTQNPVALAHPDVFPEIGHGGQSAHTQQPAALTEMQRTGPRAAGHPGMQFTAALRIESGHGHLQPERHAQAHQQHPPVPVQIMETRTQGNMCTAADDQIRRFGRQRQRQQKGLQHQ
jgi:hypothetical protein